MMNGRQTVVRRIATKRFSFSQVIAPLIVGEPVFELDGLAISIQTKSGGCVNTSLHAKMVGKMKLPETLHPSVIHSITKQHDHRASWLKTDTPAIIDGMILQEGSAELDEAIEMCAIGAPPECVISELGDVVFLTIRRITQYPNEPMPEAVSATIQRVFDLCDQLGVNPNHAALMKLLRNDLKYPHSISNNGFNQQEGVQLSKAIYSAMTGGKGDYLFYAVWEQYGEQYCHDIPENEPETTKSIVPYQAKNTSVVVYQLPNT